VFDVIRLLRHLAWQEPVGAAPLDLNGDGAIGEPDLRLAVAALLDEPGRPDQLRAVQSTADRAVIVLSDGSRFDVPRRWSERVTDVIAEAGLASKLVYAHRSFAGLQQPRLPSSRACLQIENMGIDDVFSRREPQNMRRYTALALDHIARHPVDFATAALFRMIRVFVIVPSADPWATYQYRGSFVIYAAAMIASLAYFGLFLLGVVIAVRSHRARWQLVLPIVYIPATLCYVLTNMRYTVTVQPFVFAFIAVVVVAWIDRAGGRAAANGA
jgi:hypothetical protein